MPLKSKADVPPRTAWEDSAESVGRIMAAVEGIRAAVDRKREAFGKTRAAVGRTREACGKIRASLCRIRAAVGRIGSSCAPEVEGRRPAAHCVGGLSSERAA